MGDFACNHADSYVNDVLAVAKAYRAATQRGQTVQAGQPIAEVGDRGESTGLHLHFQIEINNQPVDAVGFYGQQSAPPLCGQRE